MDSDEGKIYVGGISWDTEENLLREHFSRYGKVLKVDIPKRSTGRSRGFGVVLFSDPAVIDMVLEDKHQIDHREVNVKRFTFLTKKIKKKVKRFTSREEQNPAGRSRNFDSGANKRILVEGLPLSLTLEEFRAYFETYGRMSDAVITIDLTTQRPRVYGSVSFDSEDSVDRILHKTFHDLNGSPVKVQRSLPKDANPGVASVGGRTGVLLGNGGAGAASGGGEAGAGAASGGDGAGAVSGGRGAGAGAANGGGGTGVLLGNGGAGTASGGEARAASGGGGAGAASGGDEAEAASGGGGAGAGAASGGDEAEAASGGGGAGAASGGDEAEAASGGGGAGGFPVYGGSGGSGYEGHMDSNRFMQPQNTGSGYPPFGYGYGYGSNIVGNRVEVQRPLPNDANPGVASGHRGTGVFLGGGGAGAASGGRGARAFPVYGGSSGSGYEGHMDSNRYMRPQNIGSGYPPYGASGYDYRGFGGYGYPAGVPYGDPGVPGASGPSSSWGAQVSSSYGNVEYGNAARGGGFGGYGYRAGAPYGNPGVPRASGPSSSWSAQLPSGYGNVGYGNADPWGGFGPGSTVMEQVGVSAGYGYGGYGGYGYPAGAPYGDPGVSGASGPSSSWGAQVPLGYGNVEYGNAAPCSAAPGSAVIEQIGGSEGNGNHQANNGQDVTVEVIQNMLWWKACTGQLRRS